MMSEHEILQRIFCMMRMDVLMCRNGKNNAPRPIKNTSKQMRYNVLAEIQDLLGTNCYYVVPPKMTNADRIRSMTDEELAEFILKVGGNIRAGLTPDGGWLNWLEQEAEDECTGF